MLCILCILLAVYFALSSWNSRQKEEERTVERCVIHVTDTDAADIVSFSYDMGSGLLSLLRNVTASGIIQKMKISRWIRVCRSRLRKR